MHVLSMTYTITNLYHNMIQGLCKCWYSYSLPWETEHWHASYEEANDCACVWVRRILRLCIQLFYCMGRSYVFVFWLDTVDGKKSFVYVLSMSLARDIYVHARYDEIVISIIESRFVNGAYLQYSSISCKESSNGNLNHTTLRC